MVSRQQAMPASTSTIAPAKRGSPDTVTSDDVALALPDNEALVWSSSKNPHRKQVRTRP